MTPFVLKMVMVPAIRLDGFISHCGMRVAWNDLVSNSSLVARNTLLD